jgi:two-component system, cell cycle response regulator
LKEQAGGDRAPDEGVRRTGNGERAVRSADPASAADRLCAEIRDRARQLAERARGLGSPDAGVARHARARLLEVDAETIADLAEDLLRVGAGLAASGSTFDLLTGSVGAGPGERPRILIAEDDEEERDAIAAALEVDYEVATVADGNLALASARLGTPDLLVLDLRLPGMDGLGVLDALRGDLTTAEVPVILLSGQADDATRVRALDLGAADFIQKPTSLGELRARIERTLRHARRQTHLRTLAQTDVLTGLANLRAFRIRLDDEVRRARRYGTALTCIMADMDHLKPVNDAFGHGAGDRAIAKVAEVLRSQLRATDLGARYGGDEFVLLLPHTSAGDGSILAERLCARLATTELAVGDRKVSLRTSFGVAALGPDDGDDSGLELVRRADEALYAAKRSGRGRVEVQSDPTASPRPTS